MEHLDLGPRGPGVLDLDDLGLGGGVAGRGGLHLVDAGREEAPVLARSRRTHALVDSFDVNLRKMEKNCKNYFFLSKMGN